MPKQQQRITCKDCGKRRRKAKLLSGRKATKTLCQSCYDNDKVSVFFRSSAGDWFTKRAIAHCTNSIPKDTDELIRLIKLYKQASSAKGWSCTQGEFALEYDYELCHKDPCKGDGFTGALVADNLFIGLKSVNREMGNIVPITNFGHRITEQGEAITSTNARAIIKDLYDLERVVSECKLIRKLNKTFTDFTARASIEPSDLFNKILEGYGHDVEGYRLPIDRVKEGFFTLHNLPRVLAYVFLTQYGKIEGYEPF
jgi:hypothetical protein